MFETTLAGWFRAVESAWFRRRKPLDISLGAALATVLHYLHCTVLFISSTE